MVMFRWGTVILHTWHLFHSNTVCDINSLGRGMYSTECHSSCDNEDGTELASTQREHSLPVLSSKQVRSNLRLTITNKFQSLHATMSEAVVTLNSGKRTSFFMCITTGQSIFFVGWTWYLSFRTELLSACAHTHTNTYTRTDTKLQQSTIN